MLKDGIIIAERYEIVSRVGSGGMADVYKAMDHKLNRMVAIKILKAEFRQDTTFIAKFRKEAQAAAGLSHPNIVNVYDVGEDRGLYYIVMELIEGITLKNYIMKKGKLSVKEATSIAIQVSLGLEAAHSQGIIHRDVKPQNIIISTDGKVKLSDFGIAKATNSNTITANVMGSVHYSSPEQVRGGVSDAKSDIYSLGIAMYEMVTGRVPFDGDTTVSIAIKHLQEEIIPPSRYTSDLPYALEQIILKCTQKNPNRRYADMGELIDDLKKSLVDPQGNFVKIPSASAGSLDSLAAVGTVAAAEAQAGEVSGYASTRNGGVKRDLSGSRRSAQEKVRTQEEKKKPRPKPKKSVSSSADDDAVSSKLEKAITIGGFLIGAVIVVILIVLIGNLAGLFGNKSDSSKSGNASAVEASSAEVTQIPTETDTDSKVAVPDFKGKTLEEASDIAGQYGLIVRQSGTQSSDNYAEGQIVYQEILPDTMIKSGSTINVVISSGSTSVEIPGGLEGATQTEVENTLAALGLKVQAQLQASEVEVGRVISVSPQAGSKVPQGSDVYIYVSKGPDDGSGASPIETPTPSVTPGADNGSGNNTGEATPTVTPALTPSITPAPTAAPSSGDNQTTNGSSGLVTELSLFEPYSYEGGDITIVLVQGGQTTTIYQGADPWPDNGVATNFTIYGAAGQQTGTVQLIDWAGDVIESYEVSFPG